MAPANKITWSNVSKFVHCLEGANLSQSATSMLEGLLSCLASGWSYEGFQNVIGESHEGLHGMSAQLG